MANKIEETNKVLIQKLMGIEETGPTALGPAALTSISMAAEGAPGSTVVICTDGLANVGLGAYDEAKTEQEKAKCTEFYERLGQYAQSKGVTVNVVSIKGDECNIESLSTLSEMTGGNVERVDPTTITANFANILSQPVIATQVVTKVKIHKGLCFRNEEAANLSADKTMLVRELGNVTEGNEFTFEYTLKALADLIEMDDIDLTQIKALPFQAQIAYTGMDGNKYLRVISQLKEVSNDRKELETNANYNIIQSNAVQ